MSFRRVGQAAGLGAGAPVAAAPADQGAHGALATVAHAVGAMDKYFGFNAFQGAYGGDLFFGHFTGQHHALQAHFPGLQRAVCVVHSHLGAGVERQIRRSGAHSLQHAQILYQYGVHTDCAGQHGRLGCSGQLPVKQQGV